MTGWPVMTIARGKVVAEGGRVVGEKGFGRVLERETLTLRRVRLAALIGRGLASFRFPVTKDPSWTSFA